MLENDLDTDQSAPTSDHPMDDFPVRKLDFGARELDQDAVIWSRSSREFAIFLNAFSVHVPYFEKYLVRSMLAARKQIDDDELRRDIDAIIGQEAHHAKNFIEFNRLMADRYSKIDAMEMAAKRDFAAWAKTHSMKQLVGFTAGYETFTFLAGMIILANYERWMADSDATVKAMWVWHQVEEVEHGAVAFDVYKALYGKHEWYRKYMILKALIHIALEVIRAYLHMAREEGYMSRPKAALKSVRFLFSTLGKMAWYSLPTFSSRYHPRKHPLATTKQNRIAVAWRRFTDQGGDPLRIDRGKMDEIIGLYTP